MQEIRWLKPIPFHWDISPRGIRCSKATAALLKAFYAINDKNPNSGYYKNLGISYPNVADRARAEKAGQSAGGDVKIHPD